MKTKAVINNVQLKDLQVKPYPMTVCLVVIKASEKAFQCAINLVACINWQSSILRTLRRIEMNE